MYGRGRTVLRLAARWWAVRGSNPAPDAQTPRRSSLESPTAVDTARVQANLDAMAMALAGKCTPDEAWKTIFRSSRPWATTVVAIRRLRARE